MARKIQHTLTSVISGTSMWRIVVAVSMVLLTSLFQNDTAKAQVGLYVFSSSSGTYSPGVPASVTTPAAVFPQSWDDQTTTYSFPFNFHYNGVTYTTAGTIGIHSDGWLAFSTGSISMTGTGAGGSWVSKSDPTGVYLNGTANNNGLAVFNADLQEQAFSSVNGTLVAGSPVISSVSSFVDISVGTRLSGTGIPDGSVVSSIDALAGTITMSANATASGTFSLTPRSSIFAFTRGTAPNREFVVQWTQAKRYNGATAESISVQAILFEASGVAANQKIEVVLGDCSSSATTSLFVQCGLRGNSAADFNARTASGNWAGTVAATVNTETLQFSSAALPLNGQTYRWLPCSSAPGAAGTLFGASSVCAGSTNNYTLAAVAGATFYSWSYSGTGASFSATTLTPSNNVTFSIGATAGTLTVAASNVCGSGISTSLGITVNALPSASISYPSALLCTSTGGQVSVSVSGTTGGTFSAAPAGLSIDPSTGSITPSSSTPGAYIVTYLFSNGTCSNTATAPITVSAPLSGNYTIGTGGDFGTITAAINAYNSRCLSGPVTFSLINASYPSETFPLVIAKNSFASSVNSLTIRPATGVTATISGTANSSGLINIRGDFITIDGSNNGSNTRNLNIHNTGSVQPRAIVLGSTGTTPITNNRVRNCQLRAGTTDASVVICSDFSSIASPGYFNNIVIENNLFQNALYGIYCNAVSSGTNGSGLEIVGNDMSVTGALAIQFTGIFVQGVNGVTISKNILSNFRGTDDASDNGIWINTGVRNASITHNTITNLNYTGTNSHGARGIFISTAVTSANILIANNMIANLSGDGSDYTIPATGLNNPTGILLSAGSPQNNIRITNNTIFLGGVTGFTNTLNKTNALAACIRMRSGTTVDIQNNILVNKLGRAGTLGIGSIGILATSGISQLGLLDHNIYFIGASGSGVNSFGMMGATQYTTWAGWRALTGKDVNSLNSDPVFVSGTDLHLDAASLVNLPLNNRGKIIAEIINDYDDQTRNGLTPDVGCDEFLPSGTASWVGKVSTDWNDVRNWEAGVIPSSATDVTITGGYSFMPSISSTGSVRNISMSSPGTPPVLTLQAGAVLQVHGAMSYTGTPKINAASGTIEMNGSAAQTIPAGILHNNAVLNLVIGNSSVSGVTLGGQLDVYRSLSFSATGTNLNTGDFLTLKSSATETAWVGDVTGKTINGQATVERHIPTGLSHGKSWQLLSVPVSGAQTVNQAWQEGNTPLGNVNPGFGTIITGNMPNATTLGFDVATPFSAGPSMKTYDPATNGWTGIANTNTVPIANKKGYMIFVRGDRSVTTSNASAVPTILRTKGNLYTASAGQLPPSSTIAANSFESIGNPYASAIDFTMIGKPGPAFVDNTFYVWDPLLPGSQNLGGFQTISSVTGFKPVPGGTANYHADSVITTIQSGQAFFMHATGPGSGGVISFSESAKKQGSRNVYRETPHASATTQSFRVSLFSGTRIADASVAVFSQDYVNAYTPDDALKLFNSGENIGLSVGSSVVSVEARAPVRDKDTLFVRTSNLRRQEYRLQFTPQAMSSGAFTAWLHDRYLGSETPLSLSDTSGTSFTVNTDVASAAADRFLIIFRANLVLPVDFTGIRAKRVRQATVVVNWEVEGQQGIRAYTVERSIDGRGFAEIGEVQATGEGRAAYQFTDPSAPASACFYRVRAQDADGSQRQSSIAAVAPTDESITFYVYPNPVVNRQINLYSSREVKGNVMASLYGSNGQLLFQKRLIIQPGTISSLYPEIPLPAGKYELVLAPESGSRVSVSLFIQ